jgi:hypothetical protein
MDDEKLLLNQHDPLYVIHLRNIFKNYLTIEECCSTLHLVSKQWRSVSEQCLHLYNQDISHITSWLQFPRRKSWPSKIQYKIPVSLETQLRINKIKKIIDPTCDPKIGWKKYGIHQQFDEELANLLHIIMVDLRAPINRNDDLNNFRFLEKGDKNVYNENVPLLLPGMALDWPARKKWNPASDGTSINVNAIHTHFKCGESFESDEDVTIMLKDLFEYSLGQSDDDPLYIFDHLFIERCDSMYEDYHNGIDGHNNYKSGPSVLTKLFFPEDLMSKMITSKRPPHRWLLAGPKGSGTYIHKDPRGTIAWNALFHGVKIWALLHPKLTAKEVRSGTEFWSGEHSSLYWFINYLPDAIKECGVENVKIVVQLPGDVLVIPSSWWHAVINVENVIGVTENGVSIHSFCKEMMLAKKNNYYVDNEEGQEEQLFQQIENVFGLVDTKDAKEWYKEIFPILEEEKKQQPTE